MATFDDSTGVLASGSFPFDSLAFLLDAYEALADVSSSYSPHSPVLTLLDFNNRHFRLLS